MEPKGRSTEGLAPFASVEDLSDEQDSPGEKHRLTLPGVKEESGTKSPRMGVPTPRIDISRASSSSHQDDSSPERDLFTGGVEGGPVAKLGLGFTEEMAQELRNSTEELDFQDPTDVETKQRRRKLHQQQAINKYELEMQGEKDGKERKDSACSDTGLLYISGRTSRLSSIGSAASGGSAASHASGVSHLSAASHLSGASHFSGVSHISGTSHLSATSQLSRASRCSSPHKMLLETSFCGPKPIPTVSLDAEYPPKDSVEATLLARKTDPTGAVLPVEEGQHMVNGKPGVTKSQHKDRSHSTKSSSSTLTVGREPSIKSKSSERSTKPQNGKESRSSSVHSKTSRSGEGNSNVEICTPVKTDSEKTTPSHRKEPPRLPPGSDAKFISLHDDEEQPVSVNKNKSKNVPLGSDSRIIPLVGDDKPPANNELKRTLPLDEGSRIISLHSDEPVQPHKVPVVNTSKRKSPSKESAPRTLPVRKADSKSVSSVSRSKRKQPIKYEGDQIFIPLTGDETPIVLSGGSGKTPTVPTLDADSRIIPLHGSPEEPTNQKKTQDNEPLAKDSRIIPLKGDEIEIHTTSRRIKDGNQQQQRRKKTPLHPDASAVIIPLHGDEEIVALEIETDRPSSPEYGIYIPLKGPEIADYSRKAQLEMKSKVKPETIHKPSKLDVKPKSKSSKISPSTETKHLKKKQHQQEEELVQFISLHADESERKPLKIEITEEVLDERYNLKANEFRSKSASPVCQAEIQSIQHTYFKPDDSSAYARKHSTSSCRSPEFEGVKVKPATLDLTQIVRPSRPVQSLTQLTRDESRTPSPATSMSRGSLFRRSSESSSSTKSRASVSSEFKSRKDSKNKSVFTSLFKKGSRDSIRRKSESSEKTTPMDPRLTKVEFTFNQQDRGREEDVVIIPLHSPDSKQPSLPIEGQGEMLINPPDLTAETVQTISEVVAAIEELKSQPFVSPVPTPTLPYLIKKDETTSETVKSPMKIELPKQITEEDSQVEDVKQDEPEEIKTIEVVDIKKEEAIDSKSKTELQIQHLSVETDMSPKSETSGGSIKTQLEASFEKPDYDKKSDSETVKTGSEERRSSESELDSDAVPIPKDQSGEDDHERKSLFLQQESLEDELPYVPTTLPLERPVAHPIIPVKERVTEVKTFPIDRPRSTTPINPTTLDDYVSSPLEDAAVSPREKMQIVLPRTESLRESRSKSPHRAAAKPWTHFAEQGLQSPRELRRVASSSPPPPLPPRSTAPWVCFDEVPEKRRTPKRITTLPPAQPQTSGVIYSYVNPEECSCECHETQGRVNGAQCSDSGTRCQYKDPYRT